MSRMKLRPVQWELTIRRFGTLFFFFFFSKILLFVILTELNRAIKLWPLRTKQEALLDLLWLRLAEAGNLFAAIGRRGWGEKWRLQVRLAMAGRRNNPTPRYLVCFYCNLIYVGSACCLTGANSVLSLCRHWCHYTVTRTVSCQVQNGSETVIQRVYQSCRWPGPCANLVR